MRLIDLILFSELASCALASTTPDPRGDAFCRARTGNAGSHCMNPPVCHGASVDCSDDSISLFFSAAANQLQARGSGPSAARGDGSANIEAIDSNSGTVHYGALQEETLLIRTSTAFTTSRTSTTTRPSRITSTTTRSTTTTTTTTRPATSTTTTSTTTTTTTSTTTTTTRPATSTTTRPATSTTTTSTTTTTTRSTTPSTGRPAPSRGMRSTITRAPRFTAQSPGAPEDCSICMECMQQGDVTFQAPNCTHCFHQRCIQPWRNRGRHDCPNCRSPLWVF